MIEFSMLSPFFHNLRNNLNDDITITIGNMSYKTSRILIISHSNILKETFGDARIKSFTITNDIDPEAFGSFIEFVNNNKINVINNDNIDKLLKIAKFYKAELFHNYIVMNIDFIEYQFHQISIYENQGRSTEFLIENLASRINEIAENWKNVHKVDLQRLLQILRKANLNQLPPDTILNFCLESIKFRRKQSIEILKLFNLSKLPIEDLLLIQTVASENNVSYDFFDQINAMNQDKQQLQRDNEGISNQLQSIEKINNYNKVSIEFRSIPKQDNTFTIQAIPTQSRKIIPFLVLTIGKENVGKTSLINKYHMMKSKIHDKSNSIVQIDFIDFDDNGALFETFRAAVLKSQMILFVCSPDIEESIQFCNSFYEKALTVKRSDMIPCTFYWNKSDLKTQSVEDIENAKEFAKNIKSELIMVSAKTGDNVMSIDVEIMKKLGLPDQKSCHIF